MILTEGLSEERFVKTLLGPHFLKKNIYVIPIILKTKSVPGQKTHKGGTGSFAQFDRDLRQLLRDTSATVVTMMLDFYGLPKDFPTIKETHGKAYPERLSVCKQALRKHYDDPRFLPYFSTHEFEALLISFSEQIAISVGARPKLPPVLIADEDPEAVNLENPPSKRIINAFPTYRKALNGPAIAQAVGIAEIRKQCTLFDRWIGDIEQQAS
ncbi:MAG TPA: DUF4276 family protein [Candidatus Baltobacteraceae bacterium]|nr:DUF4276 family protein [Candidatus Baltobacteraceae bacterium]